MTTAIDFPNSPPPSNGDTVTPSNGITYTYNNGKWKGNVSSGLVNQLISGPKSIKLENDGILSTDAGNTLRIRSSGGQGSTSIEYTGNVNDPTPYNAKVEAGNQYVHIHTAGDINVWSFDAYGTLTLPSDGQIIADSNDGTYLQANPGADGYAGITSVNNNSWMWTANDGGAYISASNGGTVKTWSFNTDGRLALPGGLTFPDDYYIGGGEGSLAISSPDPVAIIANAGMNSKLWLFGTDGSITFPDATAQTTAYRNRPQNNLNLSGGTASTVFEIDMTYVDCGGSYLRGILAQDQYDGYDNGSTTTSFDKVLDGGQA